MSNSKQISYLLAKIIKLEQDLSLETNSRNKEKIIQQIDNIEKEITEVQKIADRQV